jgi:hypothetical protein
LSLYLNRKLDVPGLVEEVKQQFVPIDEQESFFFKTPFSELCTH